MTASKLALLGLCASLVLAAPLPGAETGRLLMTSGTIPEYCTAFSEAGTEAQKSHWGKLLEGARDGLTAHFCIAQSQLLAIRSGEIDKLHDPENRKRRAAQTVIRQTAYYEKRLPKGHWMHGEINRAYADAYTVLGERTKAAQHQALAASFPGVPGGRPGARSQTHSAGIAKGYVDLADRMMKSGNYAKAVELLETAKGLDPDSQLVEMKLRYARTRVAPAGK